MRKDLADNSVFYAKPVESSEDRCSMVGFLGFGDKSGSGVLDRFWFGERVFRQAIQYTIARVYSRGDKGMDRFLAVLL